MQKCGIVTQAYSQEKEKSTQIAPSQPQEKEEKIFGNLLGEEGGVREQIWSAKSTCKKNTQDKVKPTRMSLERAPLAAS